jgi:hypothetical protein
MIQSTGPSWGNLNVEQSDIDLAVNDLKEQVDADLMQLDVDVLTNTQSIQTNSTAIAAIVAVPAKVETKCVIYAQLREAENTSFVMQTQWANVAGIGNQELWPNGCGAFNRTNQPTVNFSVITNPPKLNVILTYDPVLPYIVILPAKGIEWRYAPSKRVSVKMKSATSINANGDIASAVVWCRVNYLDINKVVLSTTDNFKSILLQEEKKDDVFVANPRFELDMDMIPQNTHIVQFVPMISVTMDDPNDVAEIKLALAYGEKGKLHENSLTVRVRDVWTFSP